MVDVLEELLFVYGELREHTLQLDVFGRVPDARPALLRGYAVDRVEIPHPLEDDTAVVPLPRLRETGGRHDRVVGVVLVLTAAELEAVDEIAAPAYRRVRVRLVEGGPGWVFVHADT